MKNKSKKKSTNGSKIIIISVIAIVCVAVLMISMGTNSTNNSTNQNELVAQNDGVQNIESIKKSDTMLNVNRIMKDGSYQIRFSDLVSLEALKPYNDKTVTAIGYLSPIGAYDGSFTYLMNLPYQTCPYCLPSDTKITNTIAIFAKNGKPMEFTEAAVSVRGTLKLEPYTDEYGYSYNYRIVDVEIEEADTSALGDKITLYNKLAEKEVLTRLMDTLYAVDDNVYYDEYTANGYTYERQIVDLTNLENLIKDLETFNKEEVSILMDTATKLKAIAIEVNKLLEEKNYNKITEYKEQVGQLFYDIGGWMSIYEL